VRVRKSKRNATKMMWRSLAAVGVFATESRDRDRRAARRRIGFDISVGMRDVSDVIVISCDSCVRFAAAVAFARRASSTMKD
jgi:hypothetical protein